MNKLNIEKSIRQSIALDTPDLFDKIVDTPVKKLESADYIIKSRKEVKSRASRMQRIFATCSSLALMFAICFALAGFNSVDSIIAIDVNPSIQIATNRSDKVLSVKALNQDGKNLIANKNFKNKDYNIVVKDLVDTMTSAGYIDQSKNSVLVYVSNSNSIKANRVKTSVVTDIKDTLTEKEISAVVYNQSIPDSKDLEALAKQYNISFGKMKFINELVEKDPTLSIETLAKLSLQEISNLVAKNEIDLNGVVDCDNNITQVAEKTSGTTANPNPDVVAQNNKTESIPKNTTGDSSDNASTVDKNGNIVVGDNNEAGTTVDKSNAGTSATDTSNLGVAVPKSSCASCGSDCQCPDCAKGCTEDCPNCSKNCPNKKPSAGTTTTPPDTGTSVDPDDDVDIYDPDDAGTSTIPSTEVPDTTEDDTDDVGTSTIPDSSESTTESTESQATTSSNNDSSPISTTTLPIE